MLFVTANGGTMACLSHWCTLCSMCLLFTTSLCFANLVLEKGSQTVISCPVSKEQNITWQVRGEKDFITVTSCSFDGNICVDNMPDRYHGEVGKAGDGLQTQLVISSAWINETEFRCSTKTHFTTITLLVYERPRNPICKPVELDSTKRNLLFKCRASNVYPSAIAQLYIRGVQLSPADIINFYCSNEEADSLNPGTYVAECVWRISTAKLDTHSCRYFIRMFPNLSNMTGIKYAASQDYTFQLSIPKAVIDYTQCPVGPGVRDGKITNSSTASCRCVLESTGFPIGQARWYTYNGNESLGLDDTEDGSSTLVIPSHNPGQSYQCCAWSPLKNQLIWGPVYTPTFAAPSSDPEVLCLRMEIVAGIVAGTAALTAIVAVVVGKWRSRKRQTADVNILTYSRSCLDDEAVIYK